MRHLHSIFIRPLSMELLVFLCIFSMITISTSYGEVGETEWSALSSEQKVNWLAENRENPDFYERLLTTAEAFQEPSRSKQILDRYLPILGKPEERYRVLLKLAQIEESLGNYGDAQNHYQSAAFVRRGERDYKALFHSALLLIEQGEYSLAEVQLTRVHENTDSAELMRKAQLNLARLYALSGNHDKAESTITGIIEEEGVPEIYYLVYAVSSYLEMDEQSRTARGKLLKEFPKSPEAQLVQGLVEQAPSMEKIFGLLDRGRDRDSTPETEKTQEEQKARGVQTGSFRDVENADYMAAELEKKGFSAEVEEKTVNETKYHRVIVPIPEETQAQDILLRLKEGGFEGYPVY